MIALRKLAPAWAEAPIRLVAARGLFRGAVARALLLDRNVDFWLGELDRTWSISELRARVVEVIDETHDVKTFVLAPGSGWTTPRAGQFVTIDVEIDGVRLRRCYSLSSAPGDGRVAITVKRVAGGLVSRHLHDHVGPGSVLGLGQPAGDLVLPAIVPPKLAFVSGGSGVTPLMSVVRDLAHRGALGDVVFVHAARSRADVIFGAELEALAARHPGFRLVLRLDDAGAERLDDATLRAVVPDFAERETYLCGPGPMMDAIERLWARTPVARTLHTERFAPARPASTTAPGGVVALRLARSGKTVVAAPGTILEQLERAGERPPSGCRMGICGTCRCTVRAGTVEDVVTGVVSSEPDREIKLCVSVARSDVELAR